MNFFTKPLGKTLSVFIFLLAWVYAGWHYTLLKLPTQTTIHPQYITDFSDDKKLMWASHNVFVWKVLNHIWNESNGVLPSNQYNVLVLNNIKGSLTGSVVVEEEGWYKDGTSYVFEDDIVIADSSGKKQYSPLNNGDVYLFATRYNPANDRYTIISPLQGKKLLSIQKSGLPNDGFRNENRVRELKKAYTEETLYEWDIKGWITRNAYSRLSPEEKALIKNEIQ